MPKVLYCIAAVIFIVTNGVLPTFAAQHSVGKTEYNGEYSGEELNYIAFPIGGMGAGMFCLDGTGSISHLSVRNRPDLNNIPYCYAAIHVKDCMNGTKVLEGQVPTWKIFGPVQSGMGEGDKTYGLPRFKQATFQARFPFATINLKDGDIPLDVEITGWSPFIPTDEDNSSLPLGVIEYKFTNTSDKEIEAIFSYNAKNFIDPQGKIASLKNGFKLVPSDNSQDEGMAVFVDSDNAAVDYCWFRGDWFDSQSVAWKNVMTGTVKANDPVDGVSPGASIYVPIQLQPRETKIVKLNYCWYFPRTSLSRGIHFVAGNAFESGPSRGTEPHQNTVSGFIGKRLLNSFAGGGDGVVGEILSPEFIISKRFIKFLVGGGNQADQTSVNLIVDGEKIMTAAGINTETLNEQCWDVKRYLGKPARFQIIDRSVNPWGHILVDQFLFTDNELSDIGRPAADDILFEDFEHDGWNKWQVINIDYKDETFGIKDGVYTYKPWYSTKFNSLQAVVDYWNENSAELKKTTDSFRQSFFDSSLPPEVLEAVSANLSILKSPTVLRQHDGRFWAWEGSEDEVGSCHGSCTHVWNYAQALPHLFPAMERTMRETEFLISQNAEGHQNFRSNLPISTPPHDFHAAADGQLGGIMKVYRDWRIFGNSKWLEKLYPAIKSSLDYCIRTWDPQGKGCLEEPHHNTYDIEFWGADGMCTSFYIGALNAFVRISKFLKKPYKKYEDLLAKSISYMDKNLFNGEYYIQKPQWTGLKAKSPLDVLSFGGNYRDTEAMQLLKTEGPKYQYGAGCLSDGIIGMWMSSACGLNEPLKPANIKSHLKSVYRYNLRENMLNHYNTQRPSYATGNDGGLLLCTWPKGGMPTLPFVYSNEVWTGIEYQVASHLMNEGEVQKGLDIVRLCRNRYDGTRRNPFDEIECGHWYARAMASYSMLQSLTGVRYDAVEKTMYIDSKVGDFKTFISTNTGFGNLVYRNGKPELNVVYGTINVKNYRINNK